MWPLTIGVAVASGAVALVLTRALLPWLRRQALDRPNPRSSHAAPTPRGGGIAVLSALALGWVVAAFAGAGTPAALAPLGLGLALAAFSWIDDRHGLPVVFRLAAQGGAVAAGIALLPADALVFQGLLPVAWDRIAAGALWLWFVNLYNFMDGIDGIAGCETAAIGAGAAIVAGLVPGAAALAPHGLVTAAAALGFLWWNWAPAKVFLGDVGSVGIGYLLGWLLLMLAIEGAWAAALLLPLYHLADATLTLARRALRGDALWRAHASHGYQRAARTLGHAAVSRAVLCLDLGLIALSVATRAAPALTAAALILGGVLSGTLLWYFASRPEPLASDAR
ncbi:MAG: glycosyl transferase [Alphaproteobacteria bacterium]|nr:glycosyl transferase [Alphaproteobacteria bacterium]